MLVAVAQLKAEYNHPNPLPSCLYLHGTPGKERKLGSGALPPGKIAGSRIIENNFGGYLFLALVKRALNLHGPILIPFLTLRG